MGDIGGQLLEVALGLIFIFLALSLVCSFFQEMIATVLSWRAEFLERGIRRMLCDVDRAEHDEPKPLADQLLGSPFIREKLGRNLLTVRRAVPSYLSSRTFALALIDTLTHDQGEADALEKVRKGIASVKHPGVKRQLELMLSEADDRLDAFNRSVEAWFDDTMDRVSGWYRRRAQIVLFIVGLVVAMAFNADALDVTNRLWTDGPVREALVRQAGRTAEIEDFTALERELEDRGGALEAVKQFQLPLGWNEANGRIPDLGFGKGKENLLGWLLGVLLSAGALSFGAPFWFDALSKLGRLRVAGTQPARSGGST